MKNILIVLMVLAVATAGFATGAAEETEVVVVGIEGADLRSVIEDTSSPLFYQDILFADDNVEIRWYDMGDGAAQKVDLDVNAGDPPDVYFGYAGRVGKYAIPRYAMDLTGLVPAEDYEPSLVAWFEKDGGLYGLPETMWVQSMVVNTTLLERVGMADAVASGAWTLDVFMEASRRVAALGDGYYGYVFHAVGMGGDYWNLQFLPSFGAELFNNGQIALDTPEGLAALEWYKAYHDEGLAMPGAAGLDHPAMSQAFTEGRTLARGGSVGYAGWGVAAYEAGIAKEPFEVAFAAYPHIDGVDRVGLAVGPDAGMVFRTAPSAAVDALLKLTGRTAQEFGIYWGNFPSLLALANVGNDTTGYNEILDLLARNGAFDLGMSLTKYTEVRALIPPMFQALFNGDLTPQAAIDRFVAEGSAVLK